MSESRIILEIDGIDLEASVQLMKQVGSRIYAAKIHSLRDECGRAAVAALKDAGATRVWVDYKLHDIPNTVALRVKAMEEADILSVHASGGVEMIRAAVDAGVAKIYAVTVLTSLDAKAAHIVYGRPTDEAALKLARIAQAGGAHGIVCSPDEVALLRRDGFSKVDIIVPGIRPAGANTHDQKRFNTPSGAMRLGATRLVIGRAITEAQDPIAALDAIEEEINKHR